MLMRKQTINSLITNSGLKKLKQGGRELDGNKRCFRKLSEKDLLIFEQRHE